MFDIPISAARCLKPCIVGLSLLILAGCSSVPTRSGGLAPADTSSSQMLPALDTWQHYPLPGKQPTEFSLLRVDGRDAVVAQASSSASMLRHRVRVEPGDLGRIRFSWNVPQLIDRADMALSDSDDSPVRIVMAFEGDRSRFSLKNAMLSELSHAITGEPLPYATLMYVWCNKRPTGTVIVNPRTDRIRQMVVESGPRGLSHWHAYERNIRADFERAFGEPPGALVGVGIMTDTDNTRSLARAMYGQVDLMPVP